MLRYRIIQKCLAILVVTLLSLTLIISHACSEEESNNLTGNNGGNGHNIAKGFKAEVYENGQLVATYVTGQATLEDPLSYAYIEVLSSSQGRDFQLSFSSKDRNGINGIKPGKLSRNNYGGPYIYVGGIISSYIESDSMVCVQSSGATVANCFGEIFEIDDNHIIGSFHASGLNNEWEIKNCEFNLDLEELP